MSEPVRVRNDVPQETLVVDTAALNKDIAATKKASQGLHCKVCHHPDRVIIEQQILASRNYTAIAKDFPPINKRNLSLHFKKHMKPYQDTTIEQYIKSKAVQKVDNIQRMTHLFAYWDYQMNQIMAHLEQCTPGSPEYFQYMKSMRDMLETQQHMIKLNKDLEKGLTDRKKVTDETMIDRFNKLLAQRGKKMVMFEPLPPETVPPKGSVVVDDQQHL